jgi:hypothetical protein
MCSLLTEKKVIAAAAEHFANETGSPSDIEVGVKLWLSNNKERFNLPRECVTMVVVNLTEALIDCAQGKPILS